MIPKEAAEASIVIDVQIEEGNDEEALAELRATLLETPRRLPSRYFYDDRGSHLFERICELPEYYQTRAEGALLARFADRIVAAARPEELVELGSGAATKTRLLLDAMARAGGLGIYVPFDVSEGTVRRVARELTADYPGLAVHGVVGDFLAHLGAIPEGGRRLVIFLGGTIGNLLPERAAAFLCDLHDRMDEGDSFLLGTDLIKDVARLEAAYDDAQGVTAAFNLNILSVVNRWTDGDFDPTRFRHRAHYDRRNQWIEMRLVSLEAQRVHLPVLDLTLDLAAGEEILTEISAKFDRPKATALLAASGFELAEWMEDEERLFALSLSRWRPR